MYNNKHIIFTVVLVLILVLIGCKPKSSNVKVKPAEDKAAKEMLQGIWVNDDDEDVVFMAKGDTIFYPDSTSQPAYFQIIHDTLVIHGANEVKYPIIKQAQHLFIFKNQNGEQVKLTLSDDDNDKYSFDKRRPQALNQNKLIKKDTVITYSNKRYHSYLQINPTTYKVIKQTYNDDGVAVGNVYYDNIIHISLFDGGNKLYSHDFTKQDFSKLIPTNILNQSILSDIKYHKSDAQGIHYNAMISIPDNPSSYIVSIVISYSGQMNMSTSND